MPAWEELKKGLAQTMEEMDFVDRFAEESRQDVDLRKTRLSEKLLYREDRPLKL